MPKRPRLRKGGGREAVVPARHVPKDRGPRSRMGSRKRVLGTGRGRGSVAHRQGVGGLQRENGLRLGRGCLASQSPPPSFPSTLPKLPGSPRLPRQPLLPGAVTKETPCPPLPPLPITGVPPPSQAAAVWRVGGAMEEKNPDSRPRKGGPDLPTLRRPPSQAYILNPTAGYAATARRAPPTRPVPRQL